MLHSLRSSSDAADSKFLSESTLHAGNVTERKTRDPHYDLTGLTRNIYKHSLLPYFFNIYTNNRDIIRKIKFLIKFIIV